MLTVTCDGWNGAKTVLEGTDEIKSLYREISGGGTDRALQFEGSDYTVPADKKFIIHSVTFWNSEVAASNLKLGYGAAGITTTLFNIRQRGDQLTPQIHFPFYAEVTANNIIYGNDSSGSSQCSITVTGVLTDA